MFQQQSIRISCKIHCIAYIEQSAWQQILWFILKINFISVSQIVLILKGILFLDAFSTFTIYYLLIFILTMRNNPTTDTTCQFKWKWYRTGTSDMTEWGTFDMSSPQKANIYIYSLFVCLFVFKHNHNKLSKITILALLISTKHWELFSH